MCMHLVTYSDRAGKILCEKCLFVNRTRSYSHMAFNQSDLIMWVPRITQSDTDISDCLVDHLFAQEHCLKLTNSKLNGNFKVDVF